MFPPALYKYQRRWIKEPARRAIYVKSRQIGITWATALMCVLECSTKKNCDWYYLSASERFAKDAIEYAQAHVRAIGMALEIEHAEVLFGGIMEKQLSIRFPNGNKMVGLPANPRTARGAPGNIVLDEFGHHQDAEKIYTAAYPFTTRNKAKVRVLSTPNGKQGMFYDLWDQADEKGYAKHQTDIYTAKREGFNVDIDDLRKGFTEDAWAQEFECDFLDEATAWLPYSLIESAYDSRATIELPVSYAPTGELYLGTDVARKRDLTVNYATEDMGHEYITRAVQCMHRVEFEKQQKSHDDFMQMVTRGCIDANGIGAELAERQVKKWGEALVEGVSMHGQIPAMLATRLKDCMERGVFKIPNDPELRRDLHMVRKVHTTAGNVRFEAPRTKDGHADRFWAAALSLHAADKAPPASWAWGDKIRQLKADGPAVSQDGGLLGSPALPKGYEELLAEDGGDLEDFDPFGLNPGEE